MPRRATYYWGDLISAMSLFDCRQLYRLEGWAANCKVVEIALIKDDVDVRSLELDALTEAEFSVRLEL